MNDSETGLEKKEPELREDEALALLTARDNGIFEVLAVSDEARRRNFGDQVKLCGIMNAKSGRCSENCSFCAQSSHFSADADVFPLKDRADMVARARKIKDTGCRAFSIVTSGKGISDQELDEICRAVEEIKSSFKIECCASLGILDEKQFKRLTDAGLDRYHHNLETAESFFPQVCTTHDYAEDVQTVVIAKESGLEVCSGGLFGLGESPEQRIELAMTLKKLDVDSTPINFLNPIPKTPLAGDLRLTPEECLRTIAVYRLLMLDTDILVCGGREVNLRQLQTLIFAAGANGVMVGDYLTTQGRGIEDDLKMIADLGLRPARPFGGLREKN